MTSKENQEKWYFSLASYTYLVLKKNNNYLIYNTLSGTYIEGQNQLIYNFLHKLKHQPNNTLVFEYDKLERGVSCFIENLLKYSMGGIFSLIDSLKPPVQFTPILKIDKDNKIVSANKTMYDLRRNELNYLDELSLFLNSSDKHNECYHKQFDYPDYSLKTEEYFLDYSLIQQIVAELETSGISYVNVIGSNLLEYPFIDETIKSLNKLKETTKIYTMPIRENIDEVLLQHFVNLIADNIKNQLVFFYDSNVPFSFFKAIMRKVKHKKEIIVKAIIENESQFINFSNTLKGLNCVGGIDFIPFYNGYNEDFFKKYIWIKTEDIFTTVTSYKDIFQKKKINKWDFGKLKILHDGSIIANFNNNTIGNIHSMSIKEIIDKEINQGGSWMRTRESIHPCKYCTYQYLCPSPSNLEYVFEKHNLCNKKI